jgi:branched-chain amino acid transport system ATP-binding protein
MLLRCQDVSKRFGGIQALDGVELAVKDNEIVGLVGPNGAGKTTLFNVITGVYRPNGGNVTFRGEKLVGQQPHRICRRGIARSFQMPKPITQLTIEENLRVADRFGRGGDEWLLPPGDLLELFGLATDREAYPDRLQLVEKKYLDLARALATAPSLVCLDEFRAGLTPVEKNDTIDRVRGLHDDHDLSFLVIEHDLRVVRDLCDRVVVIDEGRNIAAGSAQSVFEDERVRETYIGGNG